MYVYISTYYILPVDSLNLNELYRNFNFEILTKLGHNVGIFTLSSSLNLIIDGT